VILAHGELKHRMDVNTCANGKFSTTICKYGVDLPEVEKYSLLYTV